jgi:hypothetical protein
VHARHRLDLVADFSVAGEVRGPMSIFDAKLAGSLSLGRKIFGLSPVIHHLGGQESHLAPNAFIGHFRKCADSTRSRRRGAVRDDSIGLKRSATRKHWPERPFS